MNPYGIAAGFILALLSFVGGIKVGMDHEIASQSDKREAIAEAVDAANSAWADKVGALKPQYTTIQNKVQREVETHTVYADCKLSPDGLQLANQALSGTKSTDQSKLPTADTPPK